jgi:leucyl-tRNA synthetase
MYMAKKTNEVSYSPQEVEAKWQKVWNDNKTFSPNLKDAKKPYYNLMMFPYPSAEGLHVGNMYAFTGTDIWGRYQRMKGNDVFEPIGLDGFGIHSENYAIKIGAHPVPQAQVTKKRFYDQLRSTGNGFAWDNTLETYDPVYYRWTQWVFVQMFKNGLAYRKKAEVNWCPSCKTVLADEQVIAGECERCKSEVEKRNLEQWFFKITDYADRLLTNLDTIEWAEKVKIAQRNWIGKSTGAEVRFKIQDSDNEISVFTTRPDTLYGVTFMALAVDSEWVDKLTTETQKQEVDSYIKDNKNTSFSHEDKEKTGVFTGNYVINPANQEKIPVYVSNYVLSGYGSGAVMGVPAHDQRDFEFANKYGIEIRPVIRAEGEADEKQQKEAYKGDGVLINSGAWTGMNVPEQMGEVIKSLETAGWGIPQVTYHLRDWLISRQRYWGPPIPMIFCENCSLSKKGEREDMPGWYTAPEDQLPVELPYVENFRPTGSGESPLAQDEKFVRVECPGCGGQARRETDVSDTFLDSAWYFLRYPSTNEADQPWNPDITKKWLPINMYIGGAEHSVLHLLYSRFVTMCFKDWGLIDFEEPFTRFYAHGLIIKDGSKMSKSKGNVVVPDTYIQKFGADTLRTYLMFLGPFELGGDFRDTGIEGMNRFIRRVWRLVTESKTGETSENEKKLMSKAVKRVTEDMDNLRYNRAIAGIMEYVNSLEEIVGNNESDSHGSISEESIKTLMLLMAPFAPHMAEEVWERLGEEKSIHLTNWPEYDEAILEEEVVQIPVQINGKLRGVVEVGKDSNQDIVEKLARENESISKYLTHEAKKVIFVPGKLINFVI